MADTQSQKKNKKKRKPSTDKNLHPVTPVAADSNKTVESDKCIINKILPQKVGMTTVFKDVEVTMTQCEAKNDVPNTTVSKKKKKKKKSAKHSGDPDHNMASTSENRPDNLLNFSENRIELVNHPEISVTLSNLHQEETEGITENDISVLPQQTEQPDASISSTGSKKKRKKKKKKNSESKELSEEPIPTAPTYEKLPANDDSCVLVVSHESFSNGSKLKLAEFADKVKLSQNGLADVLVQRKESTEEVLKHKEDSFSNSNAQVENSVSIFPVSKLKQDVVTSEINIDTAEVTAKHVNNLIKKENDEIIEEAIIPSTSEDVDESKLTKAELKAQRRAKQEAQRAAKSAKNAEKTQSSTHTPASNKSPTNAKESSLPKQSLPQTTELVASGIASRGTIETFRKVRLFSHLPECKPSNIFFRLSETASEIHPSVLEIGSQYSKGIICGSNARCVALLAAFRDVIKDYKTPPNKNFSRDLESKLQTYLNFLNSCRPLSVSMINAVKFLKHQINKIESHVEEEAKENLCKLINNFITEEILLAKEAIGNSASAKIVDGDVILVFAYSSLIREVLCKAHNQNKIFKVVVVDSRPKLEGLEMLHCLVGQGISCSYISINAVSYVMKEVSKVITGAHALLANGCVMARLGSKQVALVASAFSVPVLVCCETYKFCERVLTDSFVHNELGDPNDLIIKSLDQKDCLKNWQDLSSLQVLNLLYDVTPPDLISMVITEKGVLPCTSVPVVLRVRHAGLHE